MGGGFYSVNSRVDRSLTKGYSNTTVHNLYSADTVFQQNLKREIHKSMDPGNITIREAKDNLDHPNSYPIIIGIDVTGSMGELPVELIKELHKIMDYIFQQGIKDPQIQFIAIGDLECDRYPLQIGQFESSDEAIDVELLKVYREGGGGGNDGESYHLAWYQALNKTEFDSFVKRGQKGLIVTIGDEPCLNNLNLSAVGKLYNSEGSSYITTKELLEKVSVKWDVCHIHMTSTNTGARKSYQEYWKTLLPEKNIVFSNDISDVPKLIGNFAGKFYNAKQQVLIEEPSANVTIDDEPNFSDHAKHDML